MFKLVKFSAPLAEIVGHADAAMESIDFTTAVVKAIDKLLARQKLRPGDIAQWEVNEAFASVVLAVEPSSPADRLIRTPFASRIFLYGKSSCFLQLHNNLTIQQMIWTNVMRWKLHFGKLKHFVNILYQKCRKWQIVSF